MPIYHHFYADPALVQRQLTYEDQLNLSSHYLTAVISRHCVTSSAVIAKVVAEEDE